MTTKNNNIELEEENKQHSKREIEINELLDHPNIF